MSPDFCKAVDPVFLHVLGMLDRIGRGQRLRYDDERMRITGYLAQAEGILGNTKDWELAKYALVCWTDELLVDAEWEHRKRWTNQTLESEIYGGASLRYLKFYQKAEEASALVRRDALETYYLCVVLGFQGLYRPACDAADESGRQYNIQQERLPPDRESWARKTAMGIQYGQGRPVIPEDTMNIAGAPPLEGPFMCIWSAFFGVVLATLLAIILWSFSQPTKL
jgi:type VI secretion system protein ImpK